MALYFSLGDDAKIGFDFEANRTASRCGNFCRYACSGIKRFFCGCCFWTAQENAPLRTNLAYVRKRKSFKNKNVHNYDNASIISSEDRKNLTDGTGSTRKGGSMFSLPWSKKKALASDNRTDSTE